MAHKSFTFTVNNYKEEDIKLFTELECSYLCFGKEVGKKNKVPHLQGYVIFKKPYKLGGLKKIHGKAHWEIAKGTYEQNRKYCGKDGLFTEIDNRKQGFRSDLASACNIIKNKGMAALIEDAPETFVKYHNGLGKLAMMYQKSRDFKPKVTWIWGKTGVGKTREVVEKEKDLWISNKDLKWWDGYENQEAVLFDDFRKDFCTFHELLRIIDRYSYDVQIKGGFRKFNSKRIYITSCYHPSKVYETREDVAQLLRRIDVITEKTPICSVTEVTEVAGNTRTKVLPPPTISDIGQYFYDMKHRKISITEI